MSKSPEMNEDEFKSLVSDIWKKVHDEIGPIRKETFKLLVALPKSKANLKPNDEVKVKDKKSYEHDKDEISGELDKLEEFYQFKSVPQENDDFVKLSEFSLKAYDCARAFQEATQNLMGKKPEEVLRITTRAGVLLYYTEQILLRYKGLKSQPKPGHDDKPLPTNFGTIILSFAMTAIATARDHILAADGYVKNLKAKMGDHERRHLLEYGLLPTLIVYLFFHLITYGIPLIPSTYRVYWEVVFWSLFGAISISFITISVDVNRDVFDPRHLNKYEYKIVVAPFIAAVLVFFVSLFEIGSGGSAIKLDLANPNIPVVILLSFLSGFFGKRSLDLLDDVWQRLFPSTRLEEKKKTPTATQGSSNGSETVGTL